MSGARLFLAKTASAEAQNLLAPALKYALGWTENPMRIAWFQVMAPEARTAFTRTNYSHDGKEHSPWSMPGGPNKAKNPPCVFNFELARATTHHSTANGRANRKMSI